MLRGQAHPAGAGPSGPGHQTDKALQAVPELLGAVGALACHVLAARPGEDLVHLRPFRPVLGGEELRISPSALTGLEILPRSRESRRDSLLGLLDRTRTALGARKLRRFLTSPLRRKEAIEGRLDLVGRLMADESALRETREALRGVRDVERILAKVSAGRAGNGDLLGLAASIETHAGLPAGP